MRWAVALMFPWVVGACGDDSSPDVTPVSDWVWNLPEGFPAPAVPQDNPMTTEKVELGRLLFYDVRLSGNETQSCGSCHVQSMAFADGKAVSPGATGESTSRSSMALGNVVYASTLTWANPLMRTLEEQQLTPLFGENPIELGLPSQEVLVERLIADSRYPEMFSAAFPDDDSAITLKNMTYAISAFQRSMITADSPYDRYNYGKERDALSESARRGKGIFFSEKFECFHCHAGANFSDSVQHEGTVFEEIKFHNNGLYNIGGTGAYPEDNQGVFEISGVVEDSGRFKAPSLRNIEMTAPYMHDGSIATLEEVVDHYARGGRLIEEGPYAGDGKLNPYKSELVTGFEITEQEKADLVEFLKSLTDDSFLADPAYSDPFSD